MVPASFDNYFLAMAGAGGALIGLLFVAVSISPERTFGPGAHPLRQGMASAAYTALVNGFFISVWALAPGNSVGYIALTMSAVGLIGGAGFGVELLREQWRPGQPARERLLQMGRALVIVALTLGLYGYEGLEAVLLIQHPHTVGYLYGLSGALFGVYALGLARAWQLLGAPRTVLKWLDPMRDIRDPEVAPDAEAAGSHTT
jgi:hypothetical protein